MKAMNDWCREEGFMTGKFDGKDDMQQRMLENGKVSRWCRLSPVQPRLREREVLMMGRRMHDPRYVDIFL